VQVGEEARFSVFVPVAAGGGVSLEDCDLAVKVEGPEKTDKPSLQVQKREEDGALTLEGRFTPVSVGNGDWKA